MVTMANIHVVTDYLQQEIFLTEDAPATQYVPSREKPRQTKKHFGICLMLLSIVVVFTVLNISDQSPVNGFLGKIQ
jgi:hypothetical protein